MSPTMLNPTLLNTLAGMNVQTPQQGAEQAAQQAISGAAGQTGVDPEVARQAMLLELLQRTQAAQGEATQAGQAYQQAANAPAPLVGGLASLVPGLFGNVASILTQNPTYQQQAQQGIQTAQGTLLQRRRDNLQALEAQYQQKADAARQLGNSALELENRTKLDSIHRQQDRLDKMEEDKRHQANAIELEKLRQKGDLAVTNAKASGPAGTADELKIVNTINDNIRQDPEIKDYIVVRDQYSTGSSAAKDKSSAGDIILMRALARASDPRTGVREEEYRTFQSALGTLPALGIRLSTQLVGKGQLTDAGRNALLRRLKAIEQSKRVQADRSQARYRQQVKRYLPNNPDAEKMLIQDISAAPDATPTPTGQPQATDADRAYVQSLGLK